jgi:hypothetical protein
VLAASECAALQKFTVITAACLAEAAAWLQNTLQKEMLCQPCHAMQVVAGHLHASADLMEPK